MYTIFYLTRTFLIVGLIGNTSCSADSIVIQIGHNSKSYQPKNTLPFHQTMRGPYRKTYDFQEPGFHMQYKNEYGSGSLERFHQQYYPWAASPKSDYKQTVPTPNQENSSNQGPTIKSEPPHNIQPKIIKIKPDGSIIELRESENNNN